jgi:hypothetical protein
MEAAARTVVCFESWQYVAILLVIVVLGLVACAGWAAFAYMLAENKASKVAIKHWYSVAQTGFELRAADARMHHGETLVFRPRR